MHMPYKQGLIQEVINWFNNNAPIVSSAAAAFCMALLRSRREGFSWRDTISEAVMCSFFSLGAVTAFEYAGLPPSLAFVFGVGIGYAGTRKIGDALDRKIRGLFGGDDGNKPSRG